MSSPLGIVKWAFDNAPALAANVAVFAVFAGIVSAGVMKGLKEFRDFTKPSTTSSGATTPAQVAAATILENVTLSEWSASNREVVVAVTRLCEGLAKHQDEIADLRRVVEDVQHELHRGNNR